MPDGMYNPSCKFWACPGVASQLDVPVKTSTGPFWCEGGAVHLRAPSGCLTLSPKLSPATLQREIHFVCSYLHFFGHYPKLMTKIETSKSRSSPSASAFASPRWSCAAPALLLMLHQPACRSRTRPWDIPNTPRARRGWLTYWWPQTIRTRMKMMGVTRSGGKEKDE